MTNPINGGARKKEWHCVLENGKPMYVNIFTNVKHVIFLNKKGRPTYRNAKGIALEAKYCTPEIITALKKDEKAVMESNQRKNQTLKKSKPKVKNTKKIVIIKKTKPKPKTPTPKPKTPTPPSPAKQPCRNGERCKKGTRCNKKTGYCEPSGAKKTSKKRATPKAKMPTQPKSVSDSLQIMKYQEEELKELGLKKNDFYDDVCLVLKNIRKKLYKPEGKEKEGEWSRKKLVKLHSLIPHTRNKVGKKFSGSNLHVEQFLGDKALSFLSILGKGGYGRIHGGEYGGRECAIKESLAPMKKSIDIEDYYGEIIKQNELFCQAHRAKLSEPKYARIPKPLFIANMDKTPLLGMEPLDDSLYKFIKKTGKKNHNIDDRIKFTKIITDMFESLSNTLIYLQDKYEFYHRDMHCGNIMYRKNGESYQWFLIDFGFSTFKLHNYRFSQDGAGPYGKFNSELIQKGKAKGRVGHDLRLTLLFMFNLVDEQLYKMILPEAFDLLQSVYLKIRTEIIINAIGSSNVFWHRGYKDAFDKLVTRETEPKVFLEETVKPLRETIKIANKALYLTPPTPKATPKKEYVFVERKEGSLKI